jgi:hypothetical protein
MYPPNKGFKLIYETILVAGVLIDRYGNANGTYASPYGVPFYQRSLPFEFYNQTNYNVYQILKPVHVMVGHAIPWFGFVGCGLQYKFHTNIQNLLDAGILKHM